MAKIFGVCSYNLNFGLSIERYREVKCLIFYSEINDGSLFSIINFNTGDFWFAVLINYLMNFQKLLYYPESWVFNFFDCSRN